jgi:hypothetical protein
MVYSDLWSGTKIAHGEAELYYRYAKLTLSRDADYWTKNKNLKVENERPWPYRDIPIEYQPGALLTITLPGLFADNFREYRFWLAAWFGFLSLLNLFMGINLLPTNSQHNPNESFALVVSRDIIQEVQ